MQATLLDHARIERDWALLSERLWPAVRQDPTYNLTGLYQRLLNGSAAILEMNDGASGLWVVSFAEEGNDIIAWTAAIAGRIDGGPKRRLAEMRHALRALERTLKIAGVKAHRMCGRDYSRLFPDYQPYAGARNGLQKEL